MSITTGYGNRPLLLPVATNIYTNYGYAPAKETLLSDLKRTLLSNSNGRFLKPHKLDTGHTSHVATPDTLSAYRLGNLIGRGGFSSVYVASLPQQPGRSVALKIMSKRDIRAAQMVDKVRNEIQVHWSLKAHPNIVELYAFFEDTENVYLVLEYCESGELYRYLQHKSKLSNEAVPGKCSEAETRLFMGQIVIALQHLHSQGIVHRDLKLSNLMLAKNNQIKLGDFGLAVRLNYSGGREQNTLCGTPNFISPEILERKPHSFASDVWSLGCLMFTLLVGVSPFEGNHFSNTLDNVSRVDYSIPASVGAAAKDLISRMLQRDPVKRIRPQDILRHSFFQPTRPPTDPRRPAPEEKEILEALCTDRLKPMRQKTKHATVEITFTGHVLLDFTGDKYKVAIPGNGQTINFYRLPLTDSWSVLYSPPDASYSLETLPQRYIKKYRYAHRFVDVVRSKTAKIIFHSPQAKCLYMETSDFEAMFRSNVKVHFSPEKGAIEIRRPDQETIKVSTSTCGRSKLDDIIPCMSKVILPPDLISVWDHVVQCYKKCLEADRRELCGDLTGKTLPLVLKCSSLNVSKQATSTNDENMPPPNRTPNSRQKLSTMKDYSPSVLSQSSLAQRVRNIPAPFSERPPTVATSTISNSQQCSFRFMPNVGWCVQMQKEGPSETGPVATEFALLFTDGVRVVIETPSRTQVSQHQNNLSSAASSICSVSDNVCHVRYTGLTGGSVERFPIDRRLPAHIKQKLVHFPKFVKLFQTDA